MKLNSLFGFFAAIAFSTSAHAKTFEVDGAHSNFGFKIRHLLTNVTGKFSDFTGNFETDDKGNLIKAEATLKASSIDTGIKKRDDHLRSEDFFDAKKFAELKFVSDKFTVKKGST